MKNRKEASNDALPHRLFNARQKQPSKSLVAEAGKWHCTLVEDDLGSDGEAKRACIEHFRKMLDTANQQFPKCTPCKFATGEDHIAFQTPDGLDSFVQITFQKVRYVYDGINRMKVKEGGQQ